MLAFTNPEDTMSHSIKHIILTQYGMKNGIELWGECGIEAVKRDIEQFHNCRVISLIDPKMMITADKKKTLAYLIFIKEKQSGNIKGQGCADGRK